MKKIIALLFLLLIIPSYVNAGGGGDDTVKGMSTHNCYYSAKENNQDYIINMTLSGVDDTVLAPHVEINYFTGDSSGNTQTIFSVDAFSGQNYIFNYNKDFGTYFALANHTTNVWYSNNSSNETMKQAISNGEFCPSDVYKVYDSTNDKYMFMFCDGHTEHGDTCANVSNYINNNMKEFAKDVNNATVTKYSYVKSYSFSNVGSNDYGNTDIEDTYADIQEDKENTQDEVEQIITDNAHQTIVDQAGDQGVSEEELKVYVENLNKYEISGNALDCNSILGNPTVEGEPAFYLQFIFNMMKYISIIIVIIFSILDYVSAVSSHDDNLIKKATTKVLMRFILCVAIFVLPTIIEFLFTFIDVYSPSTCGIG